MQTIELTVYNYDELSDKAREKAISDWRMHQEYFWCDESKKSIMAFCEHFGVNLKKWEIDSCRFDYSHDATNKNFRGIKLKQFNRDFMPTGYCLDCNLWITFYDEFNRTGSALLAFESAIYEGFKSWRDDLAWQESDEYIAEHIVANEYTFLENGEIYHV